MGANDLQLLGDEIKGFEIGSKGKTSLLGDKSQPF
jgi:hypothetical protein